METRTNYWKTYLPWTLAIAMAAVAYWAWPPASTPNPKVQVITSLPDLVGRTLVAQSPDTCQGTYFISVLKAMANYQEGLNGQVSGSGGQYLLAYRSWNGWCCPCSGDSCCSCDDSNDKSGAAYASPVAMAANVSFTSDKGVNIQTTKETKDGLDLISINRTNVPDGEYTMEISGTSISQNVKIHVTVKDNRFMLMP